MSNNPSTDIRYGLCLSLLSDSFTRKNLDEEAHARNPFCCSCLLKDEFAKLDQVATARMGERAASFPISPDLIVSKQLSNALFSHCNQANEILLNDYHGGNTVDAQF